MSAGQDEEVYPNSPLVDVVCEIRFPGEMQVECDRHVFWNRIRDRYPHIMVPRVQEGQALALQHYRLQSQDRKRTISIAINSLAFSETTPYSGHVAFMQEFSDLANLFHQCYPGISTVKRVGWRYINVIPFSRAGELVPVDQFLKVNIALPGNLFVTSKIFDARFESLVEDGTVITRLAVVNRKDELKEGERPPTEGGILLDIDYGIEQGKLKFEDSAKYLDKARLRGRTIFEEIITDQYREYLRGNNL